MRCLAILLFASLLSVSAQIVPKGWLDPDSLKDAEAPIQEQLDTGKGMNATAWNMASVKDARLFVIYTLLYQKLPPKDQAQLLKEQTAWLKKRAKEIEIMTDPNGGTIVSLEQASTFMELTEQRIKTLEKRLIAK